VKPNCKQTNEVLHFAEAGYGFEAMHVLLGTGVFSFVDFLKKNE